MPYDSTITFTLDTICPWTYIAFVRLNKALDGYRAANPDCDVTFTLKLAPYQLYPDFSLQGEDKYEWYKREKYNNSDDRMKLYIDYMTTLGKEDNINFDFSTGPIANTFSAHRILTYLQSTHSPAHALSALSSLYASYFADHQHPSSPETLEKAMRAAGVADEEVARVVDDGEVMGRETRAAIAEQVGNAVDSVPCVVFEGRRRDFTLVGAKGVGEYVKALEAVVKEAR